MRVAGIIKESYVDGPGARYVLFVQGCNHHCIGCHNPDTWNYNAGTELSKEEIVNDIVGEFKSNPLLEGITLSGGEPLDKVEDLLEILENVKNQVKIKNVYCYTGYTFEELLARDDSKTLEFLKHIDVLIDGEFKLNQRCIHELYKGSLNQRIIDVNAWFEYKEIKTINFDYSE